MSAADPDREGNGEGQPLGEHPDRPELDVESAFAAIIAGWDEDEAAPGSSHPWPEAEDIPAPESPQQPAPGGAPQQPPAEPPVIHAEPVIPGLQPRPEPADPEERFVPPDPPPPPRTDVITRMAWAGVVGGPCLLLLAALVWRDLPEVLLLAAVAAFVGGFITLVARMPHDRDEDDGDGAVV